jgi:predicted flavoprotein YhiN
VREFEPSNVGYELKAPQALFDEAQGKPIKNCVLTTPLGSKQGELVITRYGLEGTPIYFLGTPGQSSLNLKPEQSAKEWLAQLQKPLRENLSPLRRIKKLGGLSEAALALLYHLTDFATRSSLEKIASAAQSLPITLLQPRPLEEAISSRGGVEWSELDEALMLKKIPGVYCAGEMIAWDAPTGGFLIQGAVALGAAVGRQLGASLSPVKSN